MASYRTEVEKGDPHHSSFGILVNHHRFVCHWMQQERFHADLHVIVSYSMIGQVEANFAQGETARQSLFVFPIREASRLLRS